MIKKIICQFCNKPCDKGNSKEWQICHPCDVSFFLIKKKINLIHFKIVKGDDFYTVILNLKENKSHIYNFKKTNVGHYATHVISFDYIIDLTPTNVQDKLKTYLLFL